MNSKSVYKIVLCALFAALTAILSQFSIPIGLVPINLATLSFFLAGGILGGTLGAASQAIYVLMGAVGLPVFAEFSGGIHVVAGPTGGYIIGYIAGAALVGFLCGRFGRKLVPLILSMVAGLAVCYFLGTCWFIFVTKTGIWQSLMACVFPFLPGDALKIAVAVVLVPRLAKVASRVGAGQAA